MLIISNNGYKLKQKIISVRDSADLKNKLMGVMVFFNLQINEQVSRAPSTYTSCSSDLQS
jgi:hypothetical protein